MKKPFWIFYLFIINAVYGQEYNFDSFYEYKSISNNSVFFFVNSTNSDYFFYGFSNSEITSGYINDIKKNEFHYFNFSNQNNLVTFEYSYTRQIFSFPFSFNKKYNYEYASVEIDSASNKLRIDKLKIRNNKKIGHCELYYQNNDFVFHDSILKFYSHGFFDDRDLEFTNNRLPYSININRYDGNFLKLTLSRKEKINLILSTKYNK
jgi:hypothetical protein